MKSQAHCPHSPADPNHSNGLVCRSERWMRSTHPPSQRTRVIWVMAGSGVCAFQIHSGTPNSSTSGIQIATDTPMHSSLHWRHNDVSNHQPHGCLLNRLFRRRSKKHQCSASLALVWGIHRGRLIPRTKGQLRKMFPFDDVIMMQYAPLHS